MAQRATSLGPKPSLCVFFFFHFFGVYFLGFCFAVFVFCFFCLEGLRVK